MNVIKAIKGDDWATKNLVEDTLKVSCFFKNIVFSFIPRNLNETAHSLAKFCFKKGKTLKWLNLFFTG